MKITPCIVMSGNALEAIHFYEKELEANVLTIQTYGEMPIPCPEALKEKVANAVLRIGESELLLFDAPSQAVTKSEKEHSFPNHLNKEAVVTMHLTIENVDKTKKLFHSLQDGGQIIAPLEAVPFSPAFGTVVDKFGVTFILMTKL
ncbi:VOC family protein [Gottfriedia luciferensis]|uniref:VOC family protein n=1 Tax=Gottfriedia luciferensis TaxID=178774 RepID=UPI000B438D8F|nr:VOC family protein [Gottfriedia luciferensis]